MRALLLPLNQQQLQISLGRRSRARRPPYYISCDVIFSMVESTSLAESESTATAPKPAAAAAADLSGEEKQGTETSILYVM